MAFLLPTFLGLLATAMNSQLVYGDTTYEQIGGWGDGRCLGGYLRSWPDQYSREKCQTMCTDSPDCYYCSYRVFIENSACEEYDSSNCGVGLLDQGLPGYTTFKKIFDPSATTTTTTTTVVPLLLPGFESVDGGAGRACRGRSASDNSKAYYHLYNNVGLFKACQSLCATTPDCQGVEHHLGGRCEVWIRPGGIGASAPVSGYTCVRRVLDNTLGCDPSGLLGCHTGYELGWKICLPIATFLSTNQFCASGWMKNSTTDTMQQCILSCKATLNCLFVAWVPGDIPDPYICDHYSSESGCDSSRVTTLGRPYQLWKLT
ncbi:unnamed protein product [Polarella glacialis]|uniref:Apple domain-containing protein n=1 Tax=Polarella glacialis TaxID=89957 RepID=A0A813LLG3_POLGL|nr:unnamed protein product [Polarella glacialis]